MDLASRTSIVVSEPMADPVEHLRAAALSTLRGKRRKPIPETLPSSVPRRPPPSTDTFQLDYGLNENTKLDIATTDKQMLDAPRSRQEPKAPAGDEEVQSREEGEISEEEEPTTRHNVPPADKSSTPSRPIKSAIADVLEENTSLVGFPHKRVPQERQMSSIPTPTLLERLSESAAPTPIFKKEEEDNFDILKDNVFDLHQDHRLSFGFLDAEHVRPGLELTQDEYDTVKDIVLDLLGWGVSFNYLIQSGISENLLYYVFTELNLRLPDNFDMSGITPYTPETITYLRQGSSVLSRQSSNEWEARPTTTILTSARTSPHIAVTAGPLQESLIDSDLQDIERQKRQELMARKAVQASRKIKLAAKASNMVKPTVSEDVVMSAAVPREIVEDFLNSLGPVQELRPPQVGKVSLPVPPEPTQHDVEMQGDSIRSPAPSLGQRTPSDGSFSEPPPSSSEAPPTSVESTVTTFSLMSEELAPTEEQAMPSGRPPPVRRGTKRPVASDFVDFESSPRKHTTASRIERRTGHNHPIGLLRRTNTGTSFHNIGGSRRCVIDLSDSEDEEEHQLSQPQQHVEEIAWEKRSFIKRQTTYISPTGVKPSDAMSPASLAQKEQEIRKMRELIAKREEETRLRKLAMAKPQSTSGTRTPVPPTSLPITLKLEDVAIAMSVVQEPAADGQMPNTIRDPDSATPPPDHSGISSSDEDNPPTAVVKQVAESFHEVVQIPSKEEQPTGQTPEGPEIQALNEPDSALQIDKPIPQNSLTTEGSVDADPNPSPSTQAELSTTTISSALQKHDVKKQDLTQSANFNNESHPDDNISAFSVYRSPFDSYPRLRGHPQRMLSDPFSISYNFSSVPSSLQPTMSSLSPDSRFASTKPSTLSSSFSSSTGVQLPDLKPLKLAAIVKSLDPLKRICHYEIPRGGTCRDEHCEDVHLSRLESVNETGVVEPNDEDAAQYLFNTIPTSWLTRCQLNSPSQILAALKDIHYRTLNNPLSFEERVAQALLSIGSPSTP